MFEAPEVGAECTDQRRHEKEAEKQGMLRPETEPFTLQEALVHKVIVSAEEGGYDRQCKECQPYGASL